MDFRFVNHNSSSSSSRYRHADSEWERIKPVFERLYVDQDLTLAHVKDILAQEHDFHVHPHQIKKRIAKWDLHKSGRRSSKTRDTNALQNASLVATCPIRDESIVLNNSNEIGRVGFENVLAEDENKSFVWFPSIPDYSIVETTSAPERLDFDKYLNASTDETFDFIATHETITMPSMMQHGLNSEKGNPPSMRATTISLDTEINDMQLLSPCDGSSERDTSTISEIRRGGDNALDENDHCFHTETLSIGADKAVQSSRSGLPVAVTKASPSGRIAPDGKAYGCPSNNCRKVFRKVGHAMNHVKQQHPEYLQLYPDYSPQQSLVDFSQTELLLLEKGFKQLPRSSTSRAKPSSANPSETIIPVTDGAEKHAKLARPSHSSNAILTCPYFKANSKRSPDCQNHGFRDIASVRHHLYNEHSRPSYYCPRCYVVFQSQDHRDDHVRNASCAIKRLDAVENWMSDTIKERVSKQLHGTDDESCWFELWDMLFPDKAQPLTPYIEDDGHREAVTHFLNLFRSLGLSATQRLLDTARIPCDNTPLSTATQDIIDEAFFILKQQSPRTHLYLETPLGEIHRPLAEDRHLSQPSQGDSLSTSFHFPQVEQCEENEEIHSQPVSVPDVDGSLLQAIDEVVATHAFAVLGPEDQRPGSASTDKRFICIFCHEVKTKTSDLRLHLHTKHGYSWDEVKRVFDRKEPYGLRVFGQYSYGDVVKNRWQIVDWRARRPKRFRSVEIVEQSEESRKRRGNGVTLEQAFDVQSPENVIS